MIKVSVLTVLCIGVFGAYAQKPKLVSDLNQDPVQQQVNHFTRFQDQLVFAYKEFDRSDKIISFQENNGTYKVLIDMDTVPNFRKIQSISSTSDRLYIRISHQMPVGHKLPGTGYYNTIWASNGDPSRTFKVFGQTDTLFSEVLNAKVVNDRYFFRAKTSTFSKKYISWTSDGTVKGTVSTKSLLRHQTLKEYFFPIQIGKFTYFLNPKKNRVWRSNKRFNKILEIKSFLEHDLDGSIAFDSGLVYSTYSKVDTTCTSGFFCETKSSFWFAEPKKNRSVLLAKSDKGLKLGPLYKLGNGVISVGGKDTSHGTQYILYLDFQDREIHKIEIPRNSEEWTIVGDKYYSTHVSYRDSIKYLYVFDISNKQTNVVDSFNINTNNIHLLSHSELYFRLSGNNQFKLGYYDLEADTLKTLPDLTSRNRSSTPLSLVSNAEQLFFRGITNNKHMLFSSSGDKLSTKPIHTGLENPFPIGTINDNLIIKEYSRNRLYSYNLSDQSTIEPLWADSTQYRNGYPDNWTPGRTVAFFTSVKAHEKYVWQTDGTAKGTKKIFEITPHKQHLEFEHFLTSGDTLFFCEKIRGWKTSRIFKIGIDDQNSHVYDFNNTEKLYVNDVTLFQEHVFFMGLSSNKSHVYEIVDSNGIKKANWFRAGVWVNKVFGTDNQLFIVTRDAKNRRILWSHDGVDLKLVYVLTKEVLQAQEAPKISIFKYSNGKLFFTLQDQQETKTSLWVSGGDSTTTASILTYDDYRKYKAEDNFSSIGWFRPDILKAISKGGKLFFKLYQPELGKELWISDGTREGTKLLLDINPGKESGDPTFFQSAGNNIYFRADDGNHGIELWKVTLDDN